MSERAEIEGVKSNETHTFLSFLRVSLEGVPTMLCILPTWSSSFDPGNSGRRLTNNQNRNIIWCVSDRTDLMTSYTTQPTLHMSIL